MRRQHLMLSLGLVVAFVAAGVALASGRPRGSVHQVAAKNGCYTSDGSSASGPGTCHNIRGGDEATTVAISPDGRFAYLSGYGTAGPPAAPPILSVFHRNPKTGVLAQLAGKPGCFSRDGSSEDGSNTCTNARDLDTGDATSIVISSDGRFLYVASQLLTSSTGQPGGIAIFARNVKTGRLHQLKGKAGCISSDGSSEDGPGTCARARGVAEVSSLHITPDQRFLYASDYDKYPQGGIAIFARSLKRGRLHQLKGQNGCMTGDGTTPVSGTNVVCERVANVSDPWDVATPDNKFAYIPAATSGSTGTDLVQAFRRNSAGGLVPLHGRGRCVSDTGTSPGGPCVDGRGLFRPERAVLSKSGRFLYINSYGYGGSTSPSPVAVLNRNLKTGLLSERSGTAACISAGGNSGEPSEPCRPGRALDGGYAGALAPEGTTLYYSEFSSNALVIFRVSPKTGAFRQLGGTFGCVTPDGSSDAGPGTCDHGRAIEGAYKVTLASKGRDVYVTGDTANGLALFHAAP